MLTSATCSTQRTRSVATCCVSQWNTAKPPCVAQSALGTFVNPEGHVHQTLTLSTVRNVVHHGYPTCESSWFPGYAWTMAGCEFCHRHLGWRFDLALDSERALQVTEEVLTAAAAAVQRGWPARFWGLRSESVAIASDSPPRDRDTMEDI